MVGRRQEERQRLTSARWIRRVTIISHFSAKGIKGYSAGAVGSCLSSIITAEGDEEVRDISSNEGIRHPANDVTKDGNNCRISRFANNNQVKKEKKKSLLLLLLLLFSVGNHKDPVSAATPCPSCPYLQLRPRQLNSRQ